MKTYSATVICDTREEFNALVKYWKSIGHNWYLNDPDYFHLGRNYNLLQLWNDDGSFCGDAYDGYYFVEDEIKESDWGGTYEEYMEYVGVNAPSVDIDVSEFL